MANKGRSEKNIFGGGYTHYGSNGKKSDAANLTSLTEDRV